MINNPLFRKFKENSLWWVLIAVFTLLLGVVTISQDGAVIDQSVIFAEQPGIDIDIEERVVDGVTLYIIKIKEDGKLISEEPIITDFDPRINEKNHKLLQETLLKKEGIDIGVYDYPEIETPVRQPSLKEQIENTKLATVRITTSDQEGRGGRGSGFSIGEYTNKKGEEREAIITNYHVVRDDSDGEVEIEIFDINGKIVKTVIGLVQYWDKESDLAVVSIPAVSKLPSVIISLTPSKLGDRVYHVGCAFGGSPTYFPPGKTPTPQTNCVVIESHFTSSKHEFVFIDTENKLGIALGRSGGGTYGVEPITGRIVLVGVCNARDESTRPPGNLGCSSTSLIKFLDIPGWDILLKQNKEEIQALIEAQK